ncbi:hypothetical protein F2Q69_00023927 [Brassica cretica]|uniref:Uncharacterized protein n=1 Tax=Brassica cretica TaxID=69181 RepID=A0A8S9Q362_BRACR|nr:hypothetical protein F2Q69_00023927 [Brassica cretica]
MNCARAGVENQNGREIRTTSGTQNHHVLPPSSSHHHISLKKNENKAMEKGKKEKKHGATGKVEQEVCTKSGVALDGRWTSWNKRGRKQYNLVIFSQNSRAEQPLVPIPAAEIFKEVSKYLGILPRASPFSS